eukprot:TRINITY_DN416_c0_g1_i4.p1 TRINITY_DN416_c0_g1~~TRINITY_DN416_c0_g1_i4.p1  ORF type:complete len:227 (-),score=26.17 TRINITY_DN416_c0_g1_i4:1004-1684(-)
MDQEEGDQPDFARYERLRSIVPRETLKILTQRSDLEGLLQLSFHVGCMLFSTFLVHLALKHDTFLWGAMALHGFFVSFLFHGLHECVHHTAFASTWLNEVVGWWYGFLCGRLPQYYTAFHFPHHRYTGDLIKDPELMDTLTDPSMNSIWKYFFYLSGIPFWLARIEIATRLLTGHVTEPWVKLQSVREKLICYLITDYVLSPSCTNLWELSKSKPCLNCLEEKGKI